MTKSDAIRYSIISNDQTIDMAKRQVTGFIESVKANLETLEIFLKKDDLGIDELLVLNSEISKITTLSGEFERIINAEFFSMTKNNAIIGTLEDLN